MNGGTNRYPMLMTVAAIYKVLAYIVGVLGIIAFFGALMSGHGFLGLIGGLIALVGAAAGAISLFAFSELIRLLINLEDNTAQTAAALKSRGPEAA